MNTAIFGKSSRLGSTLGNLLHLQGGCTSLTHAEADFRDLRALKKCCEGKAWDAVVIAAALTDVDYCEEHPSDAMLVNAEAPATIAQELAKVGTRVILMSTDFVFRGDANRPYIESAERAPASVYATSKVLAEDAVMAASRDNVIVRSSWLFGGGKPSLPDIMIRRACQQISLQVVADRWASPTYVVDLARAVAQVLQLPQVRGAVHYCNAGVCSPLEYVSYAIFQARQNGLPILTKSVEPLLKQESSVLKAPRPTYSAMNTERFTALTGHAPRLWTDALAEHIAHVASTTLVMPVAA